VLDAAVAQFLAHHARKRAVARFGDVRDTQLRSIQLVSRAHGGENGNASSLRHLDEVELARHRVDRVEDVVIARGEEVLAVRGVVARTDEVQSDIGVDVAAARGERVGLILADGGVQCLELTVQICGADSVIVDECQLADA